MGNNTMTMNEVMDKLKVHPGMHKTAIDYGLAESNQDFLKKILWRRLKWKLQTSFIIAMFLGSLAAIASGLLKDMPKLYFLFTISSIIFGAWTFVSFINASEDTTSLSPENIEDAAILERLKEEVDQCKIAKAWRDNITKNGRSITILDAHVIDTLYEHFNDSRMKDMESLKEFANA